MKTLDEIIKRDDYIRLNSALNERVSELAEKMRKKMEVLDCDELDGYNIHNMKSNCGGYCSFLATEEGNSLEDSCSYYYTGDFYCWIEAASHDEKLSFLNSARELFNTLDAIETEKCEACEKALNENKDL